MGLRIVAAAVRRLDPNKAWTPADGDHDCNWMTYTMPRPARHHNILYTMPGDALGVEQGFLTSDGEFVDRKAGMLIARAAGQTDSDRPTLFSEDLW